ncbi:hypothetical protein PoB_003880100 [Plakobranchus ocellatus]|uniref:Uncharacterized protein n=1 Tax=Plakobranchus ocellatus TaxID=259542 RepID=A0AAV4AMB3_9GAST|nr:hypothetical protein PoB_003880100 [Plakobranchus ocellatus]
MWKTVPGKTLTFCASRDFSSANPCLNRGLDRCNQYYSVKCNQWGEAAYAHLQNYFLVHEILKPLSPCIRSMMRCRRKKRKKECERRVIALV